MAAGGAAEGGGGGRRARWFGRGGGGGEWEPLLGSGGVGAAPASSAAAAGAPGAVRGEGAGEGGRGLLRPGYMIGRQRAPGVGDSRTLLLTLSFALGYVALGAAVFCQTMGLSAIDGSYLAIVTLTTVGLGDLRPKSHGERVFAAVWVLLGVGVLASAAGVGAAFAAERRRRLGMRRRRVGAGDSGGSACYGSAGSGLASLRSVSGRSGKPEERGQGWLEVALDRVVVPGLLVLLAIAMGAAFIHLRYGRPIVDSVYFAVVMLTTVGYGEFSFPDSAGRLFACFWLLFGTGTVASCMVAIAGLPLELRRRRIVARAVARQGLHEALLEEVGGPRGAVDRFDWLCFMLKGLGKVEDGDISLVMEQFDALDHNGNGVLDYTDLLRSQFINRRASAEEGFAAALDGGAGARGAADAGSGGETPIGGPIGTRRAEGLSEALQVKAPSSVRNVARARSSVMAPGESWVIGPIVGVPLPQQEQRAVSL